MLILLDGPAQGEYDTFRAPTLLRAVVGQRGRKDVLNEVMDTPRPRETVSVYHRVKIDQSGTWMCVRGKGGGCYLERRAWYEHLPDVDGDLLRDADEWRAWCRARFDPDGIFDRLQGEKI